MQAKAKILFFGLQLMAMVLAPFGLHSRNMPSLTGLVLQKKVGVKSYVVLQVRKTYVINALGPSIRAIACVHNRCKNEGTCGTRRARCI